jgi:hypothetical protein
VSEPISALDELNALRTILFTPKIGARLLLNEDTRLRLAAHLNLLQEWCDRAATALAAGTQRAEERETWYEHVTSSWKAEEADWIEERARHEALVVELRHALERVWLHGDRVPRTQFLRLMGRDDPLARAAGEEKP